MPDAAQLESRTLAATFEVRDAGSEPTIEGYAATFDQPYDMGAFRETIAPAAFARTLSGQPDVRLLIDHEGQPLARTKSGTLQLSTDATGLHMRATLDPSDPDVQRLLPKMRRGDLDQMSFAFRVPVGGDTWAEDYSLRTLRELNMSGGDVSVVTYPANPGTSVQLRSVELRDADFTLAAAMLAELRAGKTLSAANMDRLRSIVDSHGKAASHMQDASEQARALLAAGGDPDAAHDEPAAAERGLPLDLVRRRAELLAL